MTLQSNRSRGRLGALTVVLALGAVLVLAVGAAIAASIKPGKYSGPVSFQGTKSTTELVTFTVPSSKTKVKKLRLTPFIPNSCGSGGPPPKETSKAAQIKNGKFTTTVKELKTGGGFFGKATVKGKFKSGGKVSGSFKSKIPGHPECNATLQFTAQTGGG
jgi:hypothetical protein